MKWRVELTEILIAGGSVTGGIAARESAKAGFKTTIIEEHGFVGKQGKCTGLVSTAGLKRIEVDYDKIVMNEIYGAVIHSKHFSFRVEKRTPIAVVLDRRKLDEEVIREGVESGAELKLKTRLEGIKKNRVETNKGGLNFDYLIGADGFSSTTASILNLPEIKRKVLCYEAEFEGKNEEKLVDVYLDSEQFPGFFGWVVPAGVETKTGFGTSEIKKISEIRKKFLQKSEIRKFKKLKRDFHAFIPIEERSVIQKSNVLLVGNAAGQVKSTTGGGVVFGGLGAMTAVKKLDDYEREWRKQKILEKHLLIRRIVDKLDNNLLDLAVFSAGLGFNKILEIFGDMDFIFK